MVCVQGGGGGGVTSHDTGGWVCARGASGMFICDAWGLGGVASFFHGTRFRYEELRQINPKHHTFCQKDVAVIHWCVQQAVPSSLHKQPPLTL